MIKHERGNDMKIILKVFLFIVLFSKFIFAQSPLTNYSKNLPENVGPPLDFNRIPKELGHHTAEDWRVVIDST
jgi:hypothetical protein